MPLALYADIVDEADRRGLSINREVIRRLKLKRWSNQADYSRRRTPPIQPLNGSLDFD
jgi:hypothetical protein